MRSIRQYGRKDDGANLVEFALVLPLLTLFLFGIVQFGLAYDQKQSVNSAAREGARLGALDDSSLEDIAVRTTGTFDTSAASGDALIEVFDDSGLVGYRDEAGDYYNGAGGSMSVAQRQDPANMPCGDDPQSTFVRVVVTTDFEITIPAWGVRDVTIDAGAEFRCE